MADPGWIVPELVVASSLEKGLAHVRTAIATDGIDALIARIYANTDARQAAVIRELLSTRLPEIVFHNPTEHMRIPCFTVMVDEESNEDYTGDSAHFQEYLGGEKGTMPGEPWTSSIGIIVYDDHPDRVQYLYHLAKWLIAADREDLSVAFPLSHKLRGRGFEQWKQAGEAGRLLYRRTLILNAQYVQYDARLEGFSQIDDVTTSLPTTVGYGLAQL